MCFFGDSPQKGWWLPVNKFKENVFFQGSYSLRGRGTPVNEFKENVFFEDYSTCGVGASCNEFKDFVFQGFTTGGVGASCKQIQRKCVCSGIIQLAG